MLQGSELVSSEISPPKDPCTLLMEFLSCRKTQSIYTDYLPRSAAGFVAQKKADYGLAFSPRHAQFSRVYEQASFGGHCVALSQMNDPYTRMLALLLGVEVKASSGNEMEARAQLAIWIASGLWHQRMLAKAATGDIAGTDDLPMLGCIVIGHRWDIYIGYVEDSSTGDVVGFHRPSSSTEARTNAL